MVADLTPDDPSRGSYPTQFTHVEGDTVLFSASADDVEGEELWMTDGTEAGTVLLADLHPFEGSYPGEFVVLNGRVYFTAEDYLHGGEIWMIIFDEQPFDVYLPLILR